MAKQVMVIGGDMAHVCLIRRFAEVSGLEVVHEMSVDVQLAIIDADGELDMNWIHRMQTDPASAHIPVCVCSWQEAASFVCDDILINYYLQKPFLLRDFRAVLKVFGVLAT